MCKQIKQLSSSQTFFLNELRKLLNIKQTFINNGFPNDIVDSEIKRFIYKFEQYNIDKTIPIKKSLNLYYKKQFHCNYKIDEHILKKALSKKM